MVVTVTPEDLTLELQLLFREEAKRHCEELQHLPQVNIDIGTMPLANATPVEPCQPLPGEGLDLLRAKGTTRINDLKEDPQVIKPISEVDLED